MAYAEKSLNRPNKDDLICLALNYQQKYDITLNKIIKELAEIRNSYNKLELDLAIIKAVIESFINQNLTHWNANAGAMLNNPDGKLWKYLDTRNY